MKKVPFLRVLVVAHGVQVTMEVTARNNFSKENKKLINTNVVGENGGHFNT